MRPRRPASGQLEGIVLVVVGAALLVALGMALSGALHGKAVLTWLSTWGPGTGLLAIALACVVAGLRATTRRQIAAPPRAPIRPLRWWAVTAAFVLVVAATWAGVSWLLAVATPNDGPGRLEAIKTGLAIGAGTGAAIALLFTARRQWLSERAQAHTEVDSTERRVSEMYAKAADQFSTDKDSVVRLAGLYALERLAQAHPEQRVAIVNLICAYLSSTAPGSGRALGVRAGKTSEPSASPRKDRQVRLAAQAVLTDHLRADPDHRDRPTAPTFWPGTVLDLAGATLIDFDFSGCRVRAAHFTDTRFDGDTTFLDARFDAVSFRRVRFTGNTDFRSARFGSEVTFDDSTFTGDADFSSARFAKPVSFRRARFLADARFNNTSFAGGAGFPGAVFTGQVEFIAVTGLRPRQVIPGGTPASGSRS